MSNLTPVYINVYDLTEYNNYLYWLGLGIYHSGLEVHGTEYAFGAHDHPSSGVFQVEPRNTPGFQYRTTILMGTTSLNVREVKSFIENASKEYNGDSYHLIVKNCNHFANDMTMRLVGKELPGYINRLARIGWFFNCILPEALRIDAVKATPEYHTFHGETDELNTERDDVRLLSVPNSDRRDPSKRYPSSSSGQAY